MVDVVRELADFGMRVDVHGPWALPDELAAVYGIRLVPALTGTYEAVVLAVAHDAFKKLDFSQLTQSDSAIFDLKATLPREATDARL